MTGAVASTTVKPVVLFLCTGNSARSQMAESILRQRAGERFSVVSAGLDPKGVHPLTIQVLEEAGFSTQGLRSKPVSEYLGKVSVRHAIIVCRRAQESCPQVYPFAVQTHYWPFDDPAQYAGSKEMQLEKFREVRDQIAAKIGMWLSELEREESGS